MTRTINTGRQLFDLLEQATMEWLATVGPDSLTEGDLAITITDRDMFTGSARLAIARLRKP